MSTLRGPPLGPAGGPAPFSSNSPQTTPTSTGFPPLSHTAAPGGLTPAFFDATGQPVAATKMSTVGTASATESVGGRTTTETGVDDLGDRDVLVEDDDRDEDMLSMDTDDDAAGRVVDETETEMDSSSAASGFYMGGDAMDEDVDLMDNLATRSVGGFTDMDRMSDDGSASLVGFGEGAGSTVSGPIYHRRHLLPGQQSSAGAMLAARSAAGIGGGGIWGLERSSSALSDSPAGGAGRRSENIVLQREAGQSDTPVSQTAVMERREARMVDGVALDGASSDDVFVDTTTRGPIPVQPRELPMTSTGSVLPPLRNPEPQAPSPSRRAVERILQERLENQASGSGSAPLLAGSSPRGTGADSDRLGRFYFEGDK